jgi:hypothetical protein
MTAATRDLHDPSQVRSVRLQQTNKLIEIVLWAAYIVIYSAVPFMAGNKSISCSHVVLTTSKIRNSGEAVDHVSCLA